MDLATIIGILVAFGLVIAALGGEAVLFFDASSLLIVMGGTIGAVLVTYPLETVLGLMQIVKKTFMTRATEPSELIPQFVDYANRVRREGILSLEAHVKNISDDFLRKALQLTVDGLDPQMIQEILETEIACLEERHLKGAEIMQTFGTLAPGMGMVGTIIGLVLMLKRLNDPSSIGPAMALALLTTFYGAVLANLVFNPMAGKLRARSREEVLIRSMIVEGIMSISRGENPRILEEKLNSYLPPRERIVRP
ncbi:MAG: motility protein A [Desulfovibrionales bacterium]|nr:motility protein A [Desulfovibrionales bacterium]